jgi:hypothetical protein
VARIEDYALIGGLQTAALVSREGRSTGVAFPGKLRRSRRCARSGRLGARLASHEEQNRGDEQGQTDGPVGWGMGRDQESRKAEQSRDGEGHAGVAAEGDPGRDRCGYQSQASDRGEDTEFANERALGEILDQVRPRPTFRVRESVDLVDENGVGRPLQGLPRAVEDHEGHKRDPANACRGAFDPAHEEIDHDCE